MTVSGASAFAFYDESDKRRRGTLLATKDVPSFLLGRVGRSSEEAKVHGLPPPFYFYGCFLCNLDDA